MRPTTLRYALNNGRGMRAPTPLMAQARVARPQAPLRAVRFNSSGNDQVVKSNYAVLAALAALGVGGYVYMKPIRETASKVNELAEQAQKAKDQAEKALKDGAKTAQKAVSDAGLDSPGGIMDFASSYLPAVTAIIGGGGVGGVLSNLSDKDISGAIDKLRALGNEDLNKVLDKIQDALKKADGKVSKIDWKTLGTDISKEYGGKYESLVNTLIGYIPSSGDVEEYFAKLKKYSKEQVEQIDKAAEKVYKSVQKAAEKGDNVGDAFVKGIEDATPKDVEKLVDDLKKMAKDAGVPVETVDKYLKKYTADNVNSAAEYAEYIQKNFNKYAKYIPDEDVVVKQVSAFSPALGKLVHELYKEADQVAQKAEKAKPNGDKGDKKDDKKDDKKSDKGDKKDDKDEKKK